MIDLRYVKKLVDMLDESTVDSIEISSDKGMKIRLSKSPTARAAMQAVQQAAPAHASAAAPTVPAVPAVALHVAAKTDATSTFTEVKSPMVGTYYSRPEPGAEPYVQVGTRVTKGQVLCIIEAMKIMNEIECEISGTVREICVADAHPVEYGQILFRIDPNG